MEAASKLAIVYHQIFLEHLTGEHPERPDRLTHVLEALEESGLEPYLDTRAPSPAPLQWLTRVHSPSYVRYLEDFCRRGGGLLALDPTTASLASYDAARHAAGAGLLAVDLAFEGPAQPSFALVRPPGHHALADRAMGFCLFNNIAIAAIYALDHWDARRVLVVDYDVHHGNGTQDAFYGDDRVLFFSVHEHPLFPGSGFSEEAGEGPGLGYTINAPLPPGTGDKGYGKIFAEVLVPAARRFAPDLVLVSAGFDGHWRDPLASMYLSTGGYASLARTVLDLAGELCKGRIAFLLEGGYDLDALAWSVHATCSTVVGRHIVDPFGPATGREEPDLSLILARIKSIHGL